MQQLINSTCIELMSQPMKHQISAYCRLEHKIILERAHSPSLDQQYCLGEIFFWTCLCTIVYFDYCLYYWHNTQKWLKNQRFLKNYFTSSPIGFGRKTTWYLSNFNNTTLAAIVLLCALQRFTLQSSRWWKCAILILVFQWHFTNQCKNLLLQNLCPYLHLMKAHFSHLPSTRYSLKC